MKRSYIVSAVLAVLGLLALAAPAQAATATRSFADQARAVGLSTSQAASLQKEIDHYKRIVGGRQVAINKIDFKGGDVLLPLPGESTARELGAAWVSPSTTVSSCASKHLCLFSGTYYHGAKVSLYYCNPMFMVPWSGVGSWDNNQSSGVVAYFYDAAGDLWGATPRAHSWQPRANWAPVEAVDAC